MGELSLLSTIIDLAHSVSIGNSRGIGRHRVDVDPFRQELHSMKPPPEEKEQ